MLFFCAVMGGCGTKSTTPTIAYALDGPPLSIAGEYNGMLLEGEMDRTVMVGKGLLSLKDSDDAFFCEGKFAAPPTDKGRVRGMLECSKGELLAITLRNLGPDQGVAIAKPLDGSEPMVLFYHCSKEEAERRLPQVIADITEARNTLAEKDTKE